MGQYRKRMYEETHSFNTDENYNIAYKKVKRIKGFYKHLRVFLLVNAILIISSLSRNLFDNHFKVTGLENWHDYSTLFYWGIALLIHAFTVFGPDKFFNNDWEQKKIQEIMDKNADNKNKSE